MQVSKQDADDAAKFLRNVLKNNFNQTLDDGTLHTAAQRLCAAIPLSRQLNGISDQADYQGRDDRSLSLGGWQPIGTAPPGTTTIVRWHRTWKCPVAVQRNNGRFPGYPEWITATKDQTWPEDAFTPHWTENLDAPPADQA